MGQKASDWGTYLSLVLQDKWRHYFSKMYIYISLLMVAQAKRLKMGIDQAILRMALLLGRS